MRKAKGAIIACAIGLIIANVKSTAPEIRTSAEGLALIAKFEGCSLKAYKCPNDVLTVGIGSTAAGGEKIEVGKIYTNEEIAARYKKDIKAVEQCLNQYFNGALMTQKQFDAMVSLGLNVGCGNLKTYYSQRLGKRLQTTIHKRAQAKQFTQMCGRITDFDRSGGRKVRGLTIRRQAEKALCLK